ncbi:MULTISPECIES: signal peptide peptidase SppA [unclassified Roseitalea]|uniref:signal peptide peptidase SppA n=1 Tax=unclassified Roseitalea TaxID=2639107 RepID=UPI00273D5ECC|nr:MULTISPECIES: signal peptide peptidase SppA [unclassified Roseitalea]
MEPLRADDIVDRQRMRRKLTFWRIVSVLAALAIIVALAARFGTDRLGPQARPHVANVSIAGTLLGDERMLDLLEQIARSSRVAGVIVTIDSPGGTTAAGEALYHAVRDIAADKPVVARIDTLGASAGYMIATAADHIVARHTSIVGSIGVIVQYPNFSGLLESWGIEVTDIKSTPLKSEPSFFGEPPPGAERMIRQMVLDSYQWFKDLVAERRGFDAQTIDRLADGSVFTGRQGLQNGLVDALGGQDVARAWLTEQGVDPDLRTVDWEPRTPSAASLLLDSIVARFARATGLAPLSAPAVEALQERLFLDGLVSLWHAESPVSPAASNP